MEAYRLFEDAGLFYVTFTVIDWLPVFVNEQSCMIIADSLNHCHREKHLRINSFVIMPTHMHMIVFDAEFNTVRLQDTLVAMRKYTGQRLSNLVDQTMPRAFAETLRASIRTDRSRQFWQQSRHPEVITTQGFWHTKQDYLHDNPKRKGLVLDPTAWRFSSAAYWLLDKPGYSDVILTTIEW